MIRQQPQLLLSNLQQIHAGDTELPDHPEAFLCSVHY